MKREGIVKWFKEEKGYGRIMLDGEDQNHVFVHFSSVQFYLITKDFRMDSDFLKKVKKYHLI